MDKLEQQIKQIKTSLGDIEELAPFQMRSLLEVFNELHQMVQGLKVETQELRAANKKLLRTSQEWEAQCQCYQERKKQFEETIAALSQLNEQLTQRNNDLERQVQERTSELEEVLSYEAMLKSITDKVRQSLDEHHILQTALQELTKVLRVSGCNSTLYNQELTFVTLTDESTKEASSQLGCKLSIADSTQEYNQLQQGQYFQFCKLLPNIEGSVAILTCPIFDTQGILGNLLFFKPQEEGFEEQEIRLVQQVANQCAIAIRQSRLDQTAQAQVMELEKLNQLKDDFLSTVSHELRTPITNMKMAIHMLTRSLNQHQLLCAELNNPDAQNSKISRYFQILLNECERETSLINDLLDLQRLESGRQPFLPAHIQLLDWLPQLVKPFEERTKNRQQRLEIELSPDLPTLFSDSDSLERILTELLNNACKYTPPQETIKLTAKAQAGRIHLQVSNSGIEIPARELPLIFNKFYRIPKTDRWQQGGTGLGLALIQKLVERLGGTIQVKSNVELTCFTVVLPLNFSDQLFQCVQWFQYLAPPYHQNQLKNAEIPG